MTSPGPQDVINDSQGIDGNGAPLMYRFVKGRQPRNIGDITLDPTRQAWFSLKAGTNFVGTFDTGDHGTLAAEQVTGVHTYSDGMKRDHGDAVIEIMEFVIEWRKANNLPTSSAPAAIVAKATVAPVAAPAA